MVVFGSYAKGLNAKNSDIDICIIYDNVEEFNKLNVNLSIFENLDMQYFSYSEFISLLKDKSFNVGHEIVKSGVILRNLESYYDLIKYE